MSKKIALFAIVFALAGLFAGAVPAEARTSVHGYFKSNGTYVQPYYRSSSNAYRWDNYSYTPSQPRYNDSYYAPSRSYGSSWYTPDYSYQWSSNSRQSYSSLDSLFDW